jgi:anti-anti-sigma factor
MKEQNLKMGFCSGGTTMTISKTQENERITFFVEGRLDAITSPELKKVLIPSFEKAKEVIVDFTDLTHLYTDGLRVLLIAQKEAKEKGSEMKVANVSKNVMQVLVMTNFTNILTII